MILDPKVDRYGYLPAVEEHMNFTRLLNAFRSNAPFTVPNQGV